MLGLVPPYKHLPILNLYDELDTAKELDLLHFNVSWNHSGPLFRPPAINTEPEEKIVVFSVVFFPDTADATKNALFAHIKTTYTPDNAYFSLDKQTLSVIFRSCTA